MAGVVSTREECIQMVKTLCPEANIANMEKNFIDGRADIACYCHTGSDTTPGKPLCHFRTRDRKQIASLSN